MWGHTFFFRSCGAPDFWEMANGSHSTSHIDKDNSTVSYFLLRARKCPILCWSLENLSKSLWYNTVSHLRYSFHVDNMSLHKRVAWMCLGSDKQSSCNIFICLVWHSGPFVMTTEEEITQAIKDYQTGRNGFERAVNWRSKIRDAFWTYPVAILSLQPYLFVAMDIFLWRYLI